MQKMQDSFTIHLAEDDEDDSFLFLDALRRINQTATVDISSNGEVFPEKIFGLSTLPNLIFLDINMPKKNGLECLSLLRTHPRTRHVKVVILSTSSSVPIIEKAQQWGADYYIKKPEDFHDFERLLELCLQLTQTENRVTNTFFLNDMLAQQAK